MKYFKLPDLGEGLQEAEIVAWHVQAGDQVQADQLLVSVETAKAIVDIPAPYAGEVLQTFGAPGDILHVGEPLLAYQGEGEAATVVGNLQGGDSQQSDDFCIGAAASSRAFAAPRATPAVRQLARQLGVALEGQRRQAQRCQVVRITLLEQACHVCQWTQSPADRQPDQ